MSKLFEDGAYVHQHLNLGTKRKAHGRNAKASNRTCEIRLSGIIGGPRETRPWWNCEPASQTERARTVTLHLPGRRARALSQLKGNGEPQLGRTYGAWRQSSTLQIVSRCDADAVIRAEGSIRVRPQLRRAARDRRSP